MKKVNIMVGYKKQEESAKKNKRKNLKFIMIFREVPDLGLRSAVPR
jgi:hypothetical protein